MQKILRFFCFTCLFLAIFSANADSNYVVKLGTKVQWAPYHIDTPLGADGVSVRAVACIMSRINQPFTINKTAWKRAQEETRIGKLDGFFSASRNETRDSYATLSKVFLPQKRVFYSLRSNILVPLKEYTVPYIQKNILVSARYGSNALNSLKKGKYNIGATPHTQSQLLNMLEIGRMGAVLENSLVFTELIKSSKKSMAKFYAVDQNTKNMGVYFGNIFLAKHPGFLDKFNQQVKNCTLLP